MASVVEASGGDGVERSGVELFDESVAGGVDCSEEEGRLEAFWAATVEGDGSGGTDDGCGGDVVGNVDAEEGGFVPAAGVGVGAFVAPEEATGGSDPEPVGVWLAVDPPVMGRLVVATSGGLVMPGLLGVSASYSASERRKPAYGQKASLAEGLTFRRITFGLLFHATVWIHARTLLVAPMDQELAVAHGPAAKREHMGSEDVSVSLTNRCLAFG